jgi:hypothetical protein
MKIALMGYARSGKDSIYSLIQKHKLGYVHRMAFGDALRFKFHRMFMDIPEDPKPREGYEIFGKAMRDIDKDFWVKQLSSLYRSMELQGENIVITDLRQPNEAAWCRANGFKIVYVDADPSLRRERSITDSNWKAINESEKHIENMEADYVLFNQGSMEDLENEVIMMLRLLQIEGTF